jgi:hypothetical protein
MGVCKVIQEGHPDLPSDATTWPFKISCNDYVALIEGSTMGPPPAQSLKIYKFTDLYVALIKAWHVLCR